MSGLIKSNIQKMQGREIQVLKFDIDVVNGIIMVKIRLLLDEVVFNVLFKNVSSLHIRGISTPFIIYGFQILDKSIDGWQEDRRYHINDYENGSVSFFCEDICEEI